MKIQWDGKGLPPVGAHVLAKIDFKKAPPFTIIALTEMGVDVQRHTPSFQKVEVLYASSKYCVLQTKGCECMAPTACLEFEPFLSPEQIAADKRAAKVDDLVKRFAFPEGYPTPWKALFEQMYDCGVFK